ncbi:hypothetical protein PJL18_03742 [Paenarthrobacter nicotinovorans]|nr:hypothetical protein [Paenarthrobacter nicotinovorans]
MHTQADRLGKATQFPDAHATAPERGERLLPDSEQQLVCQPQCFRDGTHGRVAPQCRTGVPQLRNRRGKSEVVNDGAAPECKAHAVGQFDVAGIQGNQQAARQQPVNGPDVVAFVRDGSPPLCLG